MVLHGLCPAGGWRVLRSHIAAHWEHHGAVAIGPLLVSLRSVTSLTKEQRDQLPMIVATIGPSTIPALVRHLDDPHEHVRATSAAALGLLGDPDTVPSLAALARDASEVVRQSVVEALGLIAGAGTNRKSAAPIRRRRQGGAQFRAPRLRDVG